MLLCQHLKLISVIQQESAAIKIVRNLAFGRSNINALMRFATDKCIDFSILIFKIELTFDGIILS
jgi:hypothetical protein